MKRNIKDILIEKRPFFRLSFFLILDAVLIFLSVWLAFLVRFEGQIPSRYFLNIYGIILLALIITLPIFYFSKLYHFSWAYVSTTELISLMKAVGLSFLILTASFLILRDQNVFTGFPRSTLFITYFFIFILCGGIRFAKRIYSETFKGKDVSEKEKTLIVGAGGAGEQILRNILDSKFISYSPIAFVDDNPTKQGVLIHGIKVLGKIKDIPKIVQEKKITSMIIALPSAGSKIIKKAVEEGRKAGLMDIKVLPPISELINGTSNASIGVLREIEMAGLLGRKTVVLNQKLVENFIQNKIVLITGGAGSIGSELCRQIAKFRPSLLLAVDQDETGIFNISEEFKDNFPRIKAKFLIADICDEKKMQSIFKKFRPNLVFHAAAYKHVPLMEEQFDEAVRNNIFGTKIIAENALKFKAEKFIFISTDKAVNPTSIMGASKRVGEMICQDLNKKNSTKFISVRFGNVLGSRGSVVPVFKEYIDRGGPVKITHKDMKRYFMVTNEACLLVLEAGAMGQGGEVFVLDMGNPIRIIDLAKELIRRSGFEPDQEIKIEYTKPRPGEKFFEEILTSEEGTIATQNEKIFKARLSDINKNKLNSGLVTLSGTSDKKLIIKTLWELIPSYKPNNQF